MVVVAFMLIAPIQPFLTNSDGITHTDLTTIGGGDVPSLPPTGADPQGSDAEDTLSGSQAYIGKEGYVKVIVATTNIGELASSCMNIIIRRELLAGSRQKAWPSRS
jgi:hypothetical protein